MQKLCYELEVYSFHIDFAGHMSNIAYIQWMEIGRTKLLEAIGMPLHTVTKDGIVPILVQTNITYKSPLFLGDRVSIELWFSELRNVSAVIQFRFWNPQGSLAAEGWQKGLFVDRDTMRPKRLRPEERALFNAYLHQPVAASPENQFVEMT